MLGPDPKNHLCGSDPGDDTQRRFRYQYACGAKLLIGMLSIQPRPVCLWCEHHEDLLVEHEGGTYDAYQVKTRLEELGPWTLSDSALKNSIDRFAKLELKYPGRINSYTFVSNVGSYESSDMTKKRRSPALCLRAVRSASAFPDLEAGWQAVVVELTKDLPHSREHLFSVLKKVDLVKGPPLDGFEAIIAHTDVGGYTACRGARPSRLNELRDEVMHLVAKASAMPYDTPEAAWVSVICARDADPRIDSKKVLPSQVERILNESQPIPFRFAPVNSQIITGSIARRGRLEKKLARGGLGDQIDTMQRRTLSAERHLLGIADRMPELMDAIADQLDSVVKGVCDDERAIASATRAEPYGQQMYAGVVQELRRKAREEAESVYNQTSECLIGVAGLLSEDCKVWWSPAFDMEAED